MQSRYLASVLALILCALLLPRAVHAVDESLCRHSLQEAKEIIKRGMVHYAEAVARIKDAGNMAINERNRSCLNQARIDLGRLYLEGGDYRKALKVLKVLQKKDPSSRSDAAVNNFLGVAYYYEEMYDEASFHFKRAVSLDPKMKIAFFNMKSINSRLRHLNAARAYQKAKDYDRALEEYNNLLWVSPNFVDGRYRLGLLYHQMGRTDDALKEFKRAYNINPKHRLAHLILKSMGDIHAERGDFISAVDHYSAALQLRPNYTAAEKALEKYQFQE